MDRKSSISGRFSLSTTNIASPIAESTHINGANNQTKYSWGNSNRTPTNLENNLRKSVSKVNMSPLNKIDSRTYTDVNSKGLTARIVKYHENSTKLNRSLSVGNLYNKPGQFPVVHLKKTEIQYNPKKNLNNVSMVRIAPPDKSIFQANTRSSILRTGSIVPTVKLQTREECESRENKPILHPVQNDLNPTRSVLDALKEISRKRINSDELDSNDSIKKYCKKPEIITGRTLPSYSSSYTSVLSKRQRETQTSPNAKVHSPEQALKKRMYTKNNDIMSSLSSSVVMNTPKRKFYHIQGRPSISERRKSSSDISISPLPKQPCNDNNYVPVSKYNTDYLITPLPDTPAIESFKYQQVISKQISTETLNTNNCNNQKHKPKLTLFNKNYAEKAKNNSEIEKSNSNTSDVNEEDECLTGISFVKPKNKSPISTGKNVILERAQQSKLALMLSCLRGELDDETDEIDNKTDKQNEEKVETTKNELPSYSEVTVSTAPTISGSLNTESAAVTFVTNTTLSTFTTPSTSISQTPAESLVSTANPLLTSAGTTVQNGLSFGLNPVNATLSTVSSTNTAITQVDTTPNPKPVLSLNNQQPASQIGFSFGDLANSQKSITTAIITPPSVTTVQTVNNSSGSVNSSTTSTAVGSFTFGVPSSNSLGTNLIISTTNTTISPSIPPIQSSQLFSFSEPKKDLLNAPPVSTNTNTSSTSFSSSQPAFNLITLAPSALNNFVNPGNSQLQHQQQQNPTTTAAEFPSSNISSGFNSGNNVSTFSSISKQNTLFSTSTTGFDGNAGNTNSQFERKTPNIGHSCWYVSQQTTQAATKLTGSFDSHPFGIPTFATASNAISTTSSNNKPGFSFSQTTSPPVATAQASANIDPFGKNTTSDSAANASIFANPSVFNKPFQTTASSSEGFTFNQNAAQQQTSASPFSFNSSNNNNSNNENKTGGGFSFPTSNTGSTSNNLGQSNKTFSFKTTTQEPTATAFGPVKNPTTASGSGGFAFNNSPLNETKNLFGPPVTSVSNQTSGFSNTFSFASNMTNNNNNNNGPNLTGPSTSLFSANNNNNNNNVNSVFANATNQSNLFGNPSENLNKNAAPPAFGVPPQNNNSPFSFSNNQSTSSQQNNNNNSNNAFVFGTTAQAQVQNPPDAGNKPFNFGGSTSNVNPFGSGGIVNKPPAFNFSATPGTLGGGIQTQDGNVFNTPTNVFSIGTGGSNLTNMARRQTRTATRRIK